MKQSSGFGMYSLTEYERSKAFIELGKLSDLICEYYVLSKYSHLLRRYLFILSVNFYFSTFNDITLLTSFTLSTIFFFSVTYKRHDSEIIPQDLFNVYRDGFVSKCERF